MFGKPKQLKKLDIQLMALQALFAMYAQLPAEKQRMVLAKAPEDLAECVRAAVAAGHAGAAREMLDRSASKVPAGIADEQWAGIMRPGLEALA